MTDHTLRWVCCGLCCAILGGCGADRLGHTMRSWQGGHFDEVTRAWGQPDRCETIEGRRICAWYDVVSRLSVPTSRTCIRSLEIGPEGRITGWRWRGDYCFTTANRVLARAQVERPDALAGRRHTPVDPAPATAQSAPAPAAENR